MRATNYYWNDWLKSSEIVYSRSLRAMAFTEYLGDQTPENWKTYCLYRNKAKTVSVGDIMFVLVSL